MISWTSLGNVIVPLTKRSPLQQGWSPQCDAQPADPDEWGVLKTTAIQAGCFEENANKRLPGVLDPRPALEVAPGDLLITCAGPRARCGVPALVRHTRSRLMISGKMYRLRVAAEMDPRFLEFYLLSSEAQRRIDSMKTGISESGLNLTKERFLSLPVPVASLDQQRRIVEKLEDHLSHLDAAVNYLALAARRCDHLIESWLRKELQPTASEVLRLGDVLVDSRGGWSRSRHHLVAPGTGTPYLKMNNIDRRGVLVLDEIVHVDAEPADLAKYAIRSGDVLFNSKNSGDLIGKTAVADERIAGWVFNENIMRLRFGELVLSEFAGLWFLSAQARQQITQSASASTNVAAVYYRSLREFDIWVPALDTQARLAAEHREIRGEVDRVKVELARQTRRSVALRRSLLAAAFSGRLTGANSDIDRALDQVEPDQEAIAG